MSGIQQLLQRRCILCGCTLVVSFNTCLGGGDICLHLIYTILQLRVGVLSGRFSLSMAV